MKIKYHFLWVLCLLFIGCGIEPPKPDHEKQPPVQRQKITHEMRISENEAKTIFLDVRQKAVCLFQMLETFRKSEDFKTWGFAQNGPYRDWPKNIDALRTAADSVIPFFPISESDGSAFDPMTDRSDYSKMPLDWRISTGLTHLRLYGIECASPVPSEVERERLKNEFLQCFFDSGTLETKSKPQEDELKTESMPDEKSTKSAIEEETDKEKPEPPLPYNIQKIKTGSVKINRKWFKMRDDVLIEKFGWNGKEMGDLRNAASQKELEQNPQAVMMTGEMWEVWEEVKDEIEQRTKTKEFVFQKEPEECVFPIGPGLYCVEVPIRYTSKSGKKKETTLTFQVEVP